MNMTRFFTDDADLRKLLKDFSLFPLRDVENDWKRLLIFDEEIKETFFDYDEVDHFERPLQEFLSKHLLWQPLDPFLRDAHAPSCDHCIYLLTKNSWYKCYLFDRKILFVREKRFDTVERLKDGDLLASPNGLSIYARVILDEYLQPYRKALEIAGKVERSGSGRKLDSGYLLVLTTEELIDNLTTTLISEMDDRQIQNERSIELRPMVSVLNNCVQSLQSVLSKYGHVKVRYVPL